MINGKIIVVCLPAYNAEKTLERTYNEIDKNIVDEIILVDDASTDKTVELAHRLEIKYIIKHDNNKGYGGNQKSCYQKALLLNADIIIMLHPDYQYNPALIPAMAHLIASNVYSIVLASRILGNGALKNGMPFYKYFFNRLLTFIQNILLRQKLSEYHTGYRAYSKEALSSVCLKNFSDDYIFDNQLLAYFLYKAYNVGEISCPANYFPEASSINFFRSVQYGVGVFATSVKYRLNKWGLLRSKIFTN